MSDKSTDDTELFDSVPSETVADDGDDTLELETESKDEQPDDIKLNEPKKPSAEQQAQKQVEAWTLKVINGDVDVNELPKDVKWLKPSIEKKLAMSQKEPEINDLVEKAVAKKADEDAFLKLKSSLNDLSLNKEQRSDLQVEFAELLQAGLPKSKALRKALKIVGATTVEIDEVKRANAALPKAGNAEVRDDVELTNENHADIPSEKRVELYEKIRRPGFNINA